MFDLYTWPTPNGRKVSILFEELEVKYSAIPINISKGDQFSGKFKTISIDNKNLLFLMRKVYLEKVVLS